MRSKYVAIAIVALLAAACANAKSETAVATVTTQATATQAPTATARPEIDVVATVAALTPAPTPVPLQQSFIPDGALARYGKGEITEHAASPDGELLALATSVGVYVYSLDPFEERWVGTTKWPVHGIAWSPDGTRLAVSEGIVRGEDDMFGEEGGIISVWDAASGQRVNVLAQPGFAANLAWLPDGLTLGLGNTRWDVATGERLESPWIPESDNSVWSPDGRLLAAEIVTSFSSRIEVWDVATQSVRSTIDTFVIGSNFAFSPNGDFLIVESFRVTLYDVDTGEEILRSPTTSEIVEFENHELLRTGQAWSPDGTRIAYGTLEAIAVVDAETGELERVLKDGDHLMQGFEWLADSETIISFSPFSGTALVWNASTGRQQAVLQLDGFTNSVASLAVSRDGRQLATGHPDYHINVWDTESGGLVHRLREPPNLPSRYRRVERVVFSPDGSMLFSGSKGFDGGFGLIWDVASGELRGKLATGSVRDAVWTAAGGRLVTMGENTDTIWDGNSGQLLYNLNEVLPFATRVASSPDGSMLAFGNWARPYDEIEIEMFETESLAKVGSVSTVCRTNYCVYFAVDWAAGGDYLLGVLVDTDVRIIIWEIASGDVVFEMDDASSIVAAISPDGNYFAIRDSVVRTVNIWDVQVNEVVRQLNGHTLSVNDLYWTAAGSTLVSGSSDGTIIIWDVSNLP